MKYLKTRKYRKFFRSLENLKEKRLKKINEIDRQVDRDIEEQKKRMVLERAMFLARLHQS